MIRFRCTRCQHALKVSGKQAGKKMYCPVCYFELIVPAESTIKSVDASRLYAVDEKPIDVREMEDRKKYLSLFCSICHTNIAVTPDQIGREIVCPECETKIVVPKSIERKIGDDLENKLDRIMSGLGTTAPGGIYDVRGEAGTSEGADRKLIPVHCKLCGTLMYAPEEQVGTELTCPDCETKTLVPGRPEPLPTEAPSGFVPASGFEGGTTFGLAGNSENVSGPLVPVVCSLCGTRMYAKESEIGGFKICPDCGRSNEIKSVPKKDLVVPEAAGSGYSVDRDATPSGRPVFRTLTDYRTVDGSLDKPNLPASPVVSPSLAPAEAQPQPQPILPPKAPGGKIDPETLWARRREQKKPSRKKESPERYRRPELPAAFFRTRIFTPFRDLWVQLRGWCVALFLSGAVLLVGLLPGMLLKAFGIGIGLLLVIFALGVLADTSRNLFLWSTSGNDLPEKEDWEEYNVAWSLILAVWFILVLLAAGAPGYLLSIGFSPGAEVRTPADQVMQTLPFFSVTTKEIIDLALFGISAFFLFPIFFLSSMESDSPFAFLSKGTIASLFHGTGLWLRFYGIGALLVLLFILVAVALSALPLTGMPPEIAFIADAVIVLLSGTFLVLLYFRLLGRFGWILEELGRSDDDDEDNDDP